MTVIGLLIIACIASMCSGAVYDIINYCIEQHNKKVCEIFDAQKVRPICGYMEYSRGGNNMNKQIVYKVNGDFNGDIKGDNVTVILMGNGNFNGDINSKDGEVVVIKGDINGDVKANKVLCPTKPKTDSNSSDCFKCAWLDENGTCKSWDVNEGKCEYVGKTQFKTLWSCDIPQGVSPYERIDFTYDGDKCVNRYKSLALANVTCPHCRKSFLKNLKVLTTVVDGEVSNTEIQNYDGYILG